ncbi:MAG: hypothetical protein QXW91_03205 [Candidatus Nitrosotenuis sp.]
MIRYAFIIAAIVVISLVMIHHQSSEATRHEKLDSNFKYVKEVKMEPIKGKPGQWLYLLKVCATDRHLAITEVVLKSDMETIYQGVNKYIAKGKCSHYGAVMKASDGKSLSYKVTEHHEAVEKILGFKQGKPGLSLSEIDRYRFILRVY